MPYFCIGPAPAEEECPQVGEFAFSETARSTCQKFAELLRSTFGPEPVGAALVVKRFEHDFGEYFEVVCYYDTGNEIAEQYALRCANEAPTKWGAK